MMKTFEKTAKFVTAMALLVGLSAAPALAQTAAPVTAPATPPAATSPTPDSIATTPPAATAPGAAAPAASATPAGTAPDANAAPAAAGAAPAGAAPAAVLPPDNSAETTTTVANPYGLGALWASGDIVARATLLILVIMSMGSWYVLITKAIMQFRIFAQAKRVNATFWQSGSVATGAQQMQPGTPFKFIAQSGLESIEQHTGLLDKIDIHSFTASALDDAVTTVQSKMQDGLALLGTVGSTAPFVGLFGTVWGIYHALTAIGIAGQASIDKVAGPVGEALIMTAIGLAVAVPAVLGYNFLVRRNKRVMDMIRKFAKRILFVLLSSDANGAGVAHSDLAGDIAVKRAAAVRA
jgi:biopolymer transport protein ExbB